MSKHIPCHSAVFLWRYEAVDALGHVYETMGNEDDAKDLGGDIHAGNETD
jgi:hypothetical protein